MKMQYLTQSRFILGLNDETKLFCTAPMSEDVDANVDDEFPAVLTDGGFQVGELAKYMLCDAPEMDTVESLDDEEALAETARRLTAEHATVAGGAFRHGNLFVRADIVIKEGKILHLYEAKGKHYDNETKFWKDEGNELSDEWRKPLYEVAFTRHVLYHACPTLEVIPYLVLVNKNALAGVGSLNPTVKDVAGTNGRELVSERLGLNKKKLGKGALEVISVRDDVWAIEDLLIEKNDEKAYRFEELIRHLSSLSMSIKNRPVTCTTTTTRRKNRSP